MAHSAQTASTWLLAVGHAIVSREKYISLATVNAVHVVAIITTSE
jgi:hypothetical protein